MSLSFLPNLLCVLRILLVYPVATLILQERYTAVLVLFAVAAFTDGLDGFLAKTFSWTSDLGRVLDPLADKLLLVTMFCCMSLVGHAPWWLTAAVLLRDLLILGGAVAYRLLIGRMHGRPTLQSKFNTFCQVMFCLAVPSQAAYGWPEPWLVTALGALCFVTTCVSGLDYVLTYSRKAAAAARGRAAVAR